MGSNFLVMPIEPNELALGMYSNFSTELTFKYVMAKIFDEKVYFAGMIKHKNDA